MKRSFEMTSYFAARMGDREVERLGQANIEMTLGEGSWCSYGGLENEAREIAEADHPQIRFFRVAPSRAYASGFSGGSVHSDGHGLTSDGLHLECGVGEMGRMA
jgi:hypothetical protein